MSFSIDLSNSDQSIKETNKDMNNQFMSGKVHFIAETFWQFCFK